MSSMPCGRHHKTADLDRLKPAAKFVPVDPIDLLVDAAAVEGELTTGVPPALVAARSRLGSRGVVVLAGNHGKALPKSKQPNWSRKDDCFLKKNLGLLSEEEIAASLGRSVTAVHLRWKRDLRLPAPSKDPRIMTANQIASGLGIDSHSVLALINRNILPAYRLPGNDVTYVIDRTTLLRWIVNPDHWVYFKPDRVGAKRPTRRGVKVFDGAFWTYARHLVLKKKALWKDKWLRIGEVARLHGVSISTVNQAIRKGRLKALDWGNWWILQSVATDPSIRFLVNPGKGKPCIDRFSVSPHAKAFLVLARAVGLIYHEIDVMMGWTERRAEWIFKRLVNERQIPGIIREFGLKVCFDPKTGEVFADWKMYRRRFPRLAKFMKRMKGRKKRSRLESKYFNNVKQKAEGYFSQTRKRPRE